MYDAHIHVDQYPQEKWDQYIESWKEKGIKGVLAVSTSLASTRTVLGLKERYPDFIYAAIGYHPEQTLPSNQVIYEYEDVLLKEKEKISAIGEVGLPFYEWEKLGYVSLKGHLELFQWFVQQASRHGWPISIHAVYDRVPPALAVLKQEQIKKAHFHWLKADPDVLKPLIQEGYYLSVTPEVCYRHRDQQLVRQIPIDQLLLETDGPWPFEGPFQGRETSPLLLFDSLLQVSRIKGISQELLQKQINENFSRLLHG